MKLTPLDLSIPADAIRKDFEKLKNDTSTGIKTIYENPNEIQFCGTCTDICVVSNVLATIGNFKKAKITVLKDLCAGLTKEKHNAALEVMRSCQVEVV